MVEDTSSSKDLEVSEPRVEKQFQSELGKVVKVLD